MSKLVDSENKGLIVRLPASEKQKGLNSPANSISSLECQQDSALTMGFEKKKRKFVSYCTLFLINIAYTALFYDVIIMWWPAVDIWSAASFMLIGFILIPLIAHF